MVVGSPSENERNDIQQTVGEVRPNSLFRPLCADRLYSMFSSVNGEVSIPMGEVPTLMGEVPTPSERFSPLFSGCSAVAGVVRTPPVTTVTAAAFNNVRRDIANSDSFSIIFLLFIS